ncbi:MAG: 5'-nucleotidase, lipoprotein e(P4) family [Flavobacteriaceae bacterium]|nr:5'-nucleotidase, lipoprotein e(P4) family [Flavobacteriaceae bacterium]
MKLYTFLIGLALLGCKQNIDNKADSTPIREHSIQSVLWQQKSSEYKALCYQSFNMARLHFDNILENRDNSSKPLAIITDIDETILDNSPYNANMIKKDIEYSKKSWFDWGKKENATAIVGALDFFRYVESKNVEIFYISNRNVKQQTETISNLKKIGFPYLDDKHFLLKDSTSKKQARRNVVLESHDVIMYLGDNLSDFSDVFDGLDRGMSIESVKSKLGFEFILFPNPMYGDWETKEIYSGKYDWSSHQKDSIRKSKLRGY